MSHPYFSSVHQVNVILTLRKLPLLTFVSYLGVPRCCHRLGSRISPVDDTGPLEWVKEVVQSCTLNLNRPYIFYLRSSTIDLGKSKYLSNDLPGCPPDQDDTWSSYLSTSYRLLDLVVRSRDWGSWQWSHLCFIFVSLKGDRPFSVLN